MDFETIRTRVKEDVSCMRYLHKAKNGGIICPFCESGKGPKGTGAVMYYEKDNRFYCNSCERGGDSIDAYLCDTGRDPDDKRAHREGVIELGESIGLYLDDDKRRAEWTQADREGLQRSKENRKKQESNLNGLEGVLSLSGEDIPPEALGAVKSESESAESKNTNTPGLFKDDCEKWAADIGKTDYLTQQGISPEIQKRYHVGYIVDSNEVVFPYNSNYSYYEKRKADKGQDHPYRKPKREIAGPEPLYNPKALYSGKPCFITEGIIDILSIATAGGSGSATTGAGNYTKIIEKCKEKKPAAPLILWLDNDPVNNKGHRPGQEEQAKLAAALKENGILFIEARYNLELYGLDHGDPNDLLKANPAQFEADVKANIARAEKCQALGPDMGPFLESVFTDRYKPVATGIQGLDKFLHGGLIRQTLVLLSSKPGAGKTILASMVLESMARQGIPCIYLNLEMSREQMLSRSLSRILYTGFNRKLTAVNILQAYNLTAEDKKLLVRAAQQYADEIGPYMVYNPLETSDLDEILNYLEDTAEKAIESGKPAPCVCVDYLHIITSSQKEDTGTIIKRAVQRLKEYASKYNTIVIAIEAQSRQANKSKNADMGSGRDTSALEYSGDLILQLKSGDDMDKAKGDPNIITLYVTKSRFTAFDVDSGLRFEKHGGQSYFEQLGEWHNVPECEKTPFDDDDSGEKKGKVKLSV